MMCALFMIQDCLLDNGSAVQWYLLIPYWTVLRIERANLQVLDAWSERISIMEFNERLHRVDISRGSC